MTTIGSIADLEELYDYSHGRHLCAICGNLPAISSWDDTTGFVHVCPFMFEMTDGYSTEANFDLYNLKLEDNGGGFWVTSCGFFKTRPGRYDAYISSSKTWKEKRNAVLKRDGYKCRMCGSGINLHVHHITYERIFHEDLDDLLTMCNKCHRRIHVEDCAKRKTLEV